MVWVLLITSLSIVGMIVCVIFFPTLKIGRFQMQTFWFAPFLGAILILCCLLVDPKTVGEALIADSGVNPLEILCLFISMVFISIVLDEVGFFKVLASYAVKKAKDSQYLLFIFLYTLVSVLTIFTSNDIIVITFTPFIIFFCKNSKINPLPYLISEFVAANTWSMLLIIGNPTNIFLGETFTIDFASYIQYMAIPTVFAGLTSFGIMLLIFNKSLKVKLQCEVEEVKMEDKPIFIVSLISLICCIILLAVSQWTHIQMWIIASCFGIALFIFVLIYTCINKKKFNIFKNSVTRLPINLIPLLISMFIIVLALNECGVTKKLFEFLNFDQLILTYGFTSFLTANFINNIPMSELYATILAYFETPSLPAIYASIIGSNIAAFFTPMGALAGVMFLGILKNNNINTI